MGSSGTAPLASPLHCTPIYSVLHLQPSTPPLCTAPLASPLHCTPQVSLFALEEALEGRTRQIPFDAIQALDVVMRHLPRYQTHVVKNFPVGDQLSKIHQENY